MSVVVRTATVTGSQASPATISTTGISSGDTVLLEVFTVNSVTPTVPAGFTLLASVTGGGNDVRLYSKVAGGSEGASYSVTFASGTARLGLLSIYGAVPLVAAATPTTSDNASSTNMTCAGVTTTIGNALMCCFGGAANVVTSTAGAGQTKQYDTGGSNRIHAFTETIVSTGATGTRTPTIGSAQTNRTISVAYGELATPDAPSSLSATAITASRIDLAWTDNSNNEDNFDLERSATGTGGWASVATPAANATSVSDTGLAQNTGYYYRIKAVNATGSSSYSNVAFALTLLALAPVSQPRLYLHNPPVVFAARVNLPDPATYPVEFVAFDTVTTGAYTDIEDGQLLLLGSSAGASDYGRQRVRGAATAIKVFVGKSSRGISDGELTLVDNAYITVLDLRMIWAKVPFIDSDGNIFKDGAISVGDRTTEPPPVANCGEGYAATINNDGVIIVYLPGLLSFAVADGATITGYLWDIKDGTLLVGSSLTDSFIYATFPPGFRYVSLTVTDSNGHTHTCYCPILADDPDDRLSLDGFTIDSRRITDGGQTLSIRALEDMPRVTYPDGTLAMIWDREPEGAANRDHMLVVGWLDTEESAISAQKTGLLRDTTLTILDGGARLDQLPGFSQSVADDGTRDTTELPDITWNYGTNITADWYIHYLLYWHSTALEVCNFLWSGTGDTYRVIILSSDGESLWQQVKRVADAMVPGYILTCDNAGGIAVVPDPMYQEVDDRTDVVLHDITEDDFSDIRVNYQRAPRTHWLRTGAILVQHSVSFNADGSLFLPTVFSIAPGDTPGQGVGESEDNEGLAVSQDALNNMTGHRYARVNQPITSIVLTLIQDDSAPNSITPWSEIQPALKEWVQLTLSAEYAAQRGLTFSHARCLPKEVNIRYQPTKTGTVRVVELTLEPESVGYPAQTVTKPDVPAVGDDPVVIPDPIPPPDSGLIGGQDMVAGIGKFGVYRTFDFTTPSGSGGPTWDFKSLTGADEMLTWVVDPFCPGYAPGATSGAIDGWAATTTKLYRLTDLFGTTPAATAVVTFANTALWRTVQASFGTYFVEGSNPWVLCISYYGNTGGHTGTWATFSIDGGASWSNEVDVSAFYDSGGASNSIGVYTSPKTPGLAYTIAANATANPATFGGYVSTDWGATWGAIASDNPTTPLPLWGQFNDSMVWTEDGYAPSDYATCTGGAVQDVWLGFAAPADAKQVKLTGVVNALSHKGGIGSAGYSITPGQNGVSRTVISDVSSGGGYDVPFNQTFTYQYDFAGYAGGDWPHNSDLVHATPPTSLSNLSIYFHLQTTVNGISNSASISVTVTAIEITLDDDSTYIPAAGVFVPLNGQAGEIHIPWENNDAEDVIFYGSFSRSGNRLFDLKRVNGTTVTSISPNASSKDYGINHGHFAVRCHDSDRQLVLAAGSGNDATSSASDDKQGLWFSSDGGDTWTQRIAPATSTEPYSAAFSGSLDGVVYIWGPPSYMGYSADNGATIDSRAGNLSALSATHLIGIAGGPTG